MLDEKLRELVTLAFQTSPASQANAAITAAREAEAQGGEPVRSYELVVPADASSAWLLGTAVPKLVYHLESLRARPPAFEGLILSLFVGENIHFVRAADFLPAAARLTGLTLDELYARFGTGELRTAVRADGQLLALPSKSK